MIRIRILNLKSVWGWHLWLYTWFWCINMPEIITIIIRSKLIYQDKTRKDTYGHKKKCIFTGLESRIKKWKSYVKWRSVIPRLDHIIPHRLRTPCPPHDLRSCIRLPRCPERRSTDFRARKTTDNPFSHVTDHENQRIPEPIPPSTPIRRQGTGSKRNRMP